MSHELSNLLDPSELSGQGVNYHGVDAHPSSSGDDLDLFGQVLARHDDGVSLNNTREPDTAVSHTAGSAAATRRRSGALLA